MRRFWKPGLGTLLLGLVARPATAQRAQDPPVVALQEPRPDPILPAVAVPFAVAPEFCRRGHVPLVSLQVFNTFESLVASFALRDHRSVVLDNVPLRCSEYIGRWDGTVNSGTRIAPPGIYYIQLTVDSVSQKTVRLIVTAN